MEREDMRKEYCESADMEKAWALFAADKKKAFVAVQIAPAVRVSIGERFGLARGEDAGGKLAALLRVLGADIVTDTAAAMDALLVLQARTVRERADGMLPVFSAECPLWTAHIKELSPEISAGLLPSSTELCARLLKAHYRAAFPQRSVYVIALEMGAAKKACGGADVVLSLDEFERIVECTEINLRTWKGEALDMPLGAASAAAYLCGAERGAAEAVARGLLADRSALEIARLKYSGLYSGLGADTDGRHTVTVGEGDGARMIACVASLGAADRLIEEVLAADGATAYDYVEVAAFEGGALAVGLDGEERERTLKLRRLGLLRLAQGCTAVSAEDNPAAVRLAARWEELVRSGEAFEECESLCETDLFEAEPEVVAEIAVRPFTETEMQTEAEAEIETEAEAYAEAEIETEVEAYAEAEVETAAEMEMGARASEEALVKEFAEASVAEPTEESSEKDSEEVLTEESPTEAATESVSEVLEETAATEEVIEPVETLAVFDEETEDLPQGRDPYYTRLSSRERRKLKRKNRR